MTKEQRREENKAILEIGILFTVFTSVLMSAYWIQDNIDFRTGYAFGSIGAVVVLLVWIAWNVRKK
jgi:hypothetical protein